MRRTLLPAALLLAGMLTLPALPGAAPTARAAGPGEEAVAAFRKGYALQRDMRTLEALDAYKEALRRAPFYGEAHYEIGWSYWVLGEWQQVVRHWEIARDLGAGPPELDTYLARARRNLQGKAPPLVRVPIGTRAEAEPGAPVAVALELAARFQHYNPEPEHPADRFDRFVFSPKSVLVTPDGASAYVNALEGGTTLVYDARRLRRTAVIPHRFGPGDAHLFDAEETARLLPRLRRLGAPAHPNRYRGKPVEGVFTHGGRYLWVSHYRRDYDDNGVMPSSVAVIDTRRNAIVRVMHTGPIPKFLAASPDGRFLAVVHWGDNTVGLIGIAAGEPARFRHAGEIVVGERLALDPERDVNRDRYCGYCLRGAVFTPDGRHLLVGRMSGGGIAVLDVERRRHVGSVWGMKPTPRHLLLSPDGERLYVGSNQAGYVAVYRTAHLVAAARRGDRRLAPLRETETGAGTRTIALSPDGELLYAAVNEESRLVVLQAATLARVLEISADSFPVGLDVSPDGRQVWVTSQGRRLRGGNSVTVYRVTRPAQGVAP